MWWVHIQQALDMQPGTKATGMEHVFRSTGIAFKALYIVINWQKRGPGLLDFLPAFRTHGSG